MAEKHATTQGPDPRTPLTDLYATLRSGPEGLDGAEARRRLTAYGPNELRRERRRADELRRATRRR